MHKQLIISGDADLIQNVTRGAEALDGVIQMSLSQGTSLKPPGDVLTLYVMNRAADDVMQLAAEGVRAGRLSIVIGAVSAFVDRAHRKQIAHDDDEAMWEEMETQLRNHGRVSSNFLILMALGGVIGAVGLTVDPVSQATALVAASIIAPGFEPIAKMSQGAVLHRPSLLKNGAMSLLLGYALLAAAAALTLLTLRALGSVDTREFVSQPVLEALSTFSGGSVLPTVCAGAAGVLMVASLRDTYVVGPLMALILIPGAALVGAAAAIGDVGLAGRALLRVGADVVLVFVLGCLVFFWKQKTKHRRPMLP